MKQYGIEWEQLETHNPHLSILDYKKQERTKEILRLENKIECTDNLIQHRNVLLSDVEAAIDKLDSEYQEKQAAVEKADEELYVKNEKLVEITAVLADNQALLEYNAEKITRIKDIDGIETGKTVFGGKITISQEDYVNLTELAKKQIAAENNESNLVTEVERLKRCNDELINENVSLKNEVKTIKSLRESLCKALREVDEWKLRYKKVMDFIEHLDLTKKLQAFLNTKSHGLKR